MKHLFLTLFALAAVGATAEGFVTRYTQWQNTGTLKAEDYIWTDAEGNVCPQQNDGTVYLVVTNMVWSQGFNPGMTPVWKYYGLCFDNANRSYTDGGARIELGAGGFSCTKGCQYAFATDNVRVKLMADQTWTGPDSGTATIEFGDTGHNSMPAYHKGRLAAAPEAKNWTIRKNLALWINYTNDLAHVDVRLESPARIYLPTYWTYGSVTVNETTRLGAHKLTLAGDAVLWTAGKTTTAKMAMAGIAPQGVLNPMLDALTLAPTLVLEGGADMEVAGATWDIPTLVVDNGGSTTSSISGDMTVLRAQTDVELKDGSAFEFPNALAERDVSAGFAVSGSGKVLVHADGWKLSGTLALGADVDLELLGLGKVKVTGGRSLALNPGAGKPITLDVALLSDMPDKAVTLKSGTLYLGAMSSLPTDATIDVAADAAIVLSSDDGYDASRLTGAGRGNVTFDPMTVTDTPVTASLIVVSTNEVLRIFGNGLTADTTVRLAGGTLRFESTATVSSPVEVTAGSFVEAISESLVGTLAGAVRCELAPAVTRGAKVPTRYGADLPADNNVTSLGGIWNLGPGTIVYAGGGTFVGNLDVLAVTRDARVHLTGGDYTFGGRGSSHLSAKVRFVSLADSNDYGYGRLLGIHDGGHLKFLDQTQDNESLYVPSTKNGSAYNTSTRIAVVEVGAGGKISLGAKGIVRLGSCDTKVVFRVNGGEANLDAPSAKVLIGDGNATASADFELSAGTLTLGSAITRNSGADGSGTNRLTRGRFFWSGGTLKLGRNFTAPTIFDMVDSLKKNSHWQVNGVLRETLRLDGAGTLDLSEMGRDSVANVPAGMDETEWYGTGSLTVTGGKEFVMNAFPNGASFTTAGTGTRIVVPPTAFVYDAAECAKYAGWNDNDHGKPYSTTNTALSAAAIASLTSAGTNCAFAFTREDLPVSVTNAYVTGEWNNALSISAAGGLTLENLTFAEGSTLAAAVKGGRTVCQALTGTLTLPNALFVRGAHQPDLVTSGNVALTAEGGVLGAPAWTGLHGYLAENDASSVRIWVPGALLLIR